MWAHACNPRSEKVEAGALQIFGQKSLQIKIIFQLKMNKNKASFKEALWLQLKTLKEKIHISLWQQLQYYTIWKENSHQHGNGYIKL